MNRETILSEIRRIAKENGDVAPGQELFEKLTGISTGMWRGKIWLRWSDAVTEAGLTPGRLNEAFATDALLAHLAELTRKCGHFPLYAEIRMAKVQAPAFPHHAAFNRLGDKEARIALLRRFASQRTDYADVVALLPPSETASEDDVVAAEPRTATGDGYVYMLKHGRHYKIGKTYSVPRRHREIALELPEKPDPVHAIRTDDPDGIEAYWHRRFAAKQTNGEWFALDPTDVRAFKRRKFM